MVTDLTDQKKTNSKPVGNKQIKSKLIPVADPRKISETRDTNYL